MTTCNFQDTDRSRPASLQRHRVRVCHNERTVVCRMTDCSSQERKNGRCSPIFDYKRSSGSFHSDFRVGVCHSCWLLVIERRVRVLSLAFSLALTRVPVPSLVFGNSSSSFSESGYRVSAPCYM